MSERLKRYAGPIFTSTLVLTDAAMICLAFYSGYLLRLAIKWPTLPEDIQPFGHYLGMMAVQIGCVLIVSSAYGLYREQRARPMVDEATAIAAAVSIGTLIGIACTSFLFKNSLLELDYSRGMMIYAWLLTIVFSIVGHLVHRLLKEWLRERGWGEIRVLVVGSGEVGHMIVQKLLHSPGMGYRVVGVVNGQTRKFVHGVPVLGEVADLPDLIEAHAVDEVIIGVPEATHQDLLRIIALCERGHATIKIFPDLFQIMASEITIGDLNGLPLLNVRDIALQGWRLQAKRAMDIAGAILGLVFLSPVLLLFAILIKLDSSGPVFYVQERMGLDAKPFWIIKFRSMCVDAEADGPGWTVKDDPRCTRLGRWLRQTSLDELPNLINVLWGEMSLVGPRAERPVYVEQFRRTIPRYMDRHRIKTGMTGWAAINDLRGDTSIAERTKYDLWYIENWSLLLDFKILVRTFFRTRSGRNAY
ncbi:MAG: undecaprenyl-phosphate glucose phosphotransferase [Anaerolineae bacterium]|nr:undecaprenyl-phosphate glucose phosphotransferase [Anaerolineae bacterium]